MAGKERTKKQAKNLFEGKELALIGLIIAVLAVGVTALLLTLNVSKVAWFVLGGGLVLAYLVSQWKKYMAAAEKAGVKRTVAFLFLLAGILIAAVVVVLGLVEMFKTEGQKFTEVGNAFLKNYVSWALLAVGCGWVIRWLILNLGGKTEQNFRSVGRKLTIIGKRFYQIALILCLFGMVAALALWLYCGWKTALIVLAADLLVLLFSWIISMVINGLGICTMVLEPQAEEAAAREYAALHATEVECPVCGQMTPVQYVGCRHCGAVREKK